MLVAEDEAGAEKESQSDLLFTISVENRKSPLYRTLSTLEKKEGRGPLPSPAADPHREGTGYKPPTSSLLRMITRGRPQDAPITLCVTGETVEEQERGQPR